MHSIIKLKEGEIPNLTKRVLKMTETNTQIPTFEELSAGELEQLLDRVSSALQERYQAEIKELVNQHREEHYDDLLWDLIGKAQSNSSRWSGGYSTHNLVEQIRREVCFDTLQRLKYANPAKKDS